MLSGSDDGFGGGWPKSFNLVGFAVYMECALRMEVCDLISHDWMSLQGSFVVLLVQFR
jgi:hypothetical protein